PQAAHRGVHPGLAGAGGDVPGDQGPGRPPLERVRPVTRAESPRSTSRRSTPRSTRRSRKSAARNAGIEGEQLLDRRGSGGRASRGRVRAFLRLVAIEHSVFALPFAYLSTLTAMQVTGGRINWADLGLVTVAMVGARTFAMAANRIIDRHIDARNPRTAGRELVTGAVSVRTAATGAVVALAAFLAAAALLNPLVAALAPVAVVPLVVYPYAKRFTDYPHAVLALAQAVAPVGGWLAVT